MQAQTDRYILAIGCFATVLVSLFSVSSGSLWTDEFGTWLITRANTLAEWWQRFQSWPDSDTQLPLYHLYMYIWAKAFGTGPVEMRASNAVFLLIANVAALWPFRSQRQMIVPVIAVFSSSATIWYYMNEIRPYIVLHAGSCLMLSGLVLLMADQKSSSCVGFRFLCAGSLLACGATVLGILWTGAAALFAMIYWIVLAKRPWRELFSGNYVAFAFTLLCVAALFGRALYMASLGRSPAQINDSSSLTLIFAFYTNFGLLGIGPGMLDVRAEGIRAFDGFYLNIAFSAFVLGVVAIAGISELRARIGLRAVLVAVCFVLFPILVTHSVGVATGWRVLPRHLISMVCLVGALYALGVVWWWRRGAVGMVVASTAIVILCSSALSVRYAARHAKDDYRRAAAMASAELAGGGNVWWVGDGRGLLYYSVPLRGFDFDPVHGKLIQSGSGERADGVWVVNWAVSPDLSTRKPPTLVLLSKPDSFDRRNVMQDYLHAEQYRQVQAFPAFSVWRK